MANANVVWISARVEEVERHLTGGLKHPETNVAVSALAAIDDDQ